jgi:hypothetical protein
VRKSVKGGEIADSHDDQVSANEAGRDHDHRPLELNGEPPQTRASTAASTMSTVPGCAGEIRYPNEALMRMASMVPVTAPDTNTPSQ